jgi:ABC-2 type transport system permease protein
MKSFLILCRRNLAFARLAIATNLEYRLNYFVDAIMQPALSCLIEATLWMAIFRTSGKMEIGGFTENYYISYVIWAAFVARITANWMYEFRMVEDINSGSINSALTRPMSFFEYYLSQFIGYKFVTTLISMTIPFAVSMFFDLPVHYARIPAAFFLVFFYLIFAYLMSFIVSTASFYLNRIYGLTMVKNLSLWILSGELVPLDIFPEPLRTIMMNLPFATGAFTPVAYLTGRVGTEVLLRGYLSVGVGILILSFIATWAWRKGINQYSGTGA